MSGASPSGPGSRASHHAPAGHGHSTSIPDAAGMPWNDEIAFILGRPCFMFIHEAQLFRSLGYDIPKRAEDEQAFFIHRWLNFYFIHGDAWREKANADIYEHIDRAQAIEARSGETGTGSTVGESAVRKDAPHTDQEQP